MSGGIDFYPPLSALMRTPASIVNQFSSGSYSLSGFTTAMTPQVMKDHGIVTGLSGSMTANTLKTMLSISGAGVINFFAVTPVDTTSRTIRVRITLDGIVAFDSTSGSIATVNLGPVVIGAASLNASAVSNMKITFDAIPFNASCLIEVASSVTETDKLNTGWVYRTVQ